MCKFYRILKFKIFTLLELLVVISVISILLSLLLPSLKTAKNKVRTISCINNEKQFSASFVFYSNDFADYFPKHYYGTSDTYKTWVSELWLLKYVTKGNLFRCPGMRDNPYPDSIWNSPPDSFPSGSYATSVDYGYNFSSLGGTNPSNGIKINMVRIPSATILLADSINNYYALSSGKCWGYSNLYGYFMNSSSGGLIDLRHTGMSSVTWVDGHITAEKAGNLTHAGPYGVGNNPYNAGGVFTGINTTNCHWGYYLQIQ